MSCERCKRIENENRKRAMMEILNASLSEQFRLRTHWNMLTFQIGKRVVQSTRDPVGYSSENFYHFFGSPFPVLRGEEC